MFNLSINRLKNSSLIKTSGIYTISSFINASIPFFLLPILTTRLSPADYGIVAMFQIVVSIIYPFVGMNLEASIQRKFYDKDGTDFPSYVGSCFILHIISFFIITGLFLFFIDTIFAFTLIPRFWLKYALIVAACQFFTTVVLIIFQVNIKPLKYGLFQISQSIINVLLTVLFVIILKKTWDGRLESLIITGIIFAIISIVILFKSRQIRFNLVKRDVVHALKFGLPLIPHAIGGILFTAIDRFFLTNLVGLDQTGNYSVAFQIGAIVSLVTVSFNNAFVPWLFENLALNISAIKRKIVKFTYLYFLLLIAGATLLLFLFPIIVSIFIGSSYTSINTYSTFIVFGFVFQGMYFMVTNYIAFVQKTYLQAIITIVVGLIKIPITYFSIIWFGAIGASISYCITFLLYFIATWILSARVYKMPWNLVLIKNTTDENTNT